MVDRAPHETAIGPLAPPGGVVATATAFHVERRRPAPGGGCSRRTPGRSLVGSLCMCGLSGEITFDGSLADTAAVGRMVDAVVPRGPDGQGAWSAGRVAFGHRRLSVIDLSPAGAQPMVDAELGLAIAWNGCIYNYQDLRRELRGQGYRFFSHSDTEVLLHLYRHHGPDFVDRLRGMFAIALWDRRHRRLLLARDRVGKKPLLYALRDDGLTFASEMQALLAPTGLVLNSGQMADLVLAWRQVTGLIAAIPRDRPLADDLACVFRVPPPAPATVAPAARKAPARKAVRGRR